MLSAGEEKVTKTHYLGHMENGAAIMYVDKGAENLTDSEDQITVGSDTYSVADTKFQEAWNSLHLGKWKKDVTLAPIVSYLLDMDAAEGEAMIRGGWRVTAFLEEARLGAQKAGVPFDNERAAEIQRIACGRSREEEPAKGPRKGQFIIDPKIRFE